MKRREPVGLFRKAPSCIRECFSGRHFHREAGVVEATASGYKEKASRWFKKLRACHVQGFKLKEPAGANHKNVRSGFACLK